MELFLDTASADEVRKIVPWGVVGGVTTNQRKFLEQGGVDFKERALELISLVNGPVSLELTSRTVADQVQEALEYHSWDQNHVVVKVAMRGEGSGLETIHKLHSRGIAVNATVMMTPSQAVLAAKAGANYVSLFFNRIKEAGEDPILAINQTRSILDKGALRARIIAGSIRQPKDFIDAALAGADIVTMPYGVMIQLPFHSMSEKVIDEFDKAWLEFLRLRRLPATQETLARQ